jgi:hypothetical protein
MELADRYSLQRISCQYLADLLRDLYDYSNVILTAAHEPVTIICPDHGEK